jgi:hypothetical protein
MKKMSPVTNKTANGNSWISDDSPPAMKVGFDFLSRLIPHRKSVSLSSGKTVPDIDADASSS